MDRLVGIGIYNLRALRHVEIDLDGLTVLIGENASGKSSILEACELLRKAAAPGFVSSLHTVHGGLVALLRKHERALILVARVCLTAEKGAEEYFEYRLALEWVGSFVRISHERLQRVRRPVDGRARSDVDRYLLSRNLDHADWTAYTSDDAAPTEHPLIVPDDETVLGSFVGQVADQRMEELARVREVLAAIEVHLPVDSRPIWAAADARSDNAVRSSSFLTRATRVSLFAQNLASVYQALRNREPEHWQRTLSYLKLGLGDDIVNVELDPDASVGRIALSLRYATLGVVPAAALSDGTLAWLTIVGVARLKVGCGLVAFDEPETHFHPQLVARVVDLFESMAKNGPVIVATQSDRFLDQLSDPAKSVCVCTLNDERATEIWRLDETALALWLSDYRGLGDIRAAGHERSVVAASGSK